MFPFDFTENIRKSFGFLMFSGESKANIGKIKVKTLRILNSINTTFNLNTMNFAIWFFPFV